MPVAACTQASADGKVIDKCLPIGTILVISPARFPIAVHCLAPHLDDDIELVYLPIELGNTGAAVQSLAVSLWCENRMRHENAGQTEHILICGGSCFCGARAVLLVQR